MNVFFSLERYSKLQKYFERFSPYSAHLMWERTMRLAVSWSRTVLFCSSSELKLFIKSETSASLLLALSVPLSEIRPFTYSILSISFNLLDLPFRFFPATILDTMPSDSTSKGIPNNMRIRRGIFMDILELINFSFDKINQICIMM